MDLKQKLDTLRNELNFSIEYFEYKHKKTKTRVNVVKITSVTFSVLITVVLGLNSENLVETFKNIAIVLGAVVTIINAVDAFYNYGALWVKNAVTLSKLRELKRELDFYAAGCEPEDISESKLNEFLNKLQQILKDDIKQWLRIREKVNAMEQNKEDGKIDELTINPEDFRNKLVNNENEQKIK